MADSTLKRDRPSKGSLLPVVVAALWSESKCCRLLAMRGLCVGGVESSRVEPACPKAAPLGRRETTKPKLISTLTTSASKIQ